MTLLTVLIAQLGLYCLLTIQMSLSPQTEELYMKVNKVLENLKKYNDANYLHINLKISKFIHFKSCKAKPISYPLFHDNFQLEQVTSIKFLGIYISDTLTWDAHINYLTRKISKISGSLFKMRQCIPRGMIRQVYFALVNSQLIYGINVWGSAGSASNLSKLFATQKKAIRTLFHIQRLCRYIPGHTKDAFSKNKILTVHNLYFLSTLKCTFLAIYSSPPTPIIINQIKSHVSKYCYIIASSISIIMII